MSTTDLLLGLDLPALVRVRERGHALIASLARGEAESFLALPATASAHPYLEVFGWRHPVTVAELLRQISVVAVQTSLPVPAGSDYALTRMTWRYAQPRSLGRSPADAPPHAVELRLGPLRASRGVGHKLSMQARVLDVGGDELCTLELAGGFYPWAILDHLMREATSLPPTASPEPVVIDGARLGLEATDVLIGAPELLADGQQRVGVQASRRDSIYHHNLDLEDRRHVPAVMVIEAALQLAALLRPGATLRAMALDVRAYLALDRSDTELWASSGGGQLELVLRQADADKGRVTLELDEPRSA